MSTVFSINSNNNRSMSYGKLASGKKIRTAADGASELSMIQKTERQIRGADVGAQNIRSGIGLLNIADGAMSQITDDLQRIGELGIKASSGLLTDDDRAMIQTEIDQLKQGISDIATQTTYNEMHILDGSNTEFGIVTDSNGSNKQISTGDAMLQSLGIADFDVTGDFDISDVTNALKKVSTLRSAGGAQTNALEHAYNNTTNYVLNSTASKSRLEDLDIPKAVSEMDKKKLLQTYRMHMLQRSMEDKKNKTARMFM